jgi:hypothetical protein
MILAHELAHIRRHDFLVNLLQAAVETLLFYHPAVWWISRQVRIERENCCDDLAVSVCGSPLQYARALTRLEELRAEVLPLALSARGGSLLNRIRRMVSSPAATTVPVRGVTALALLVGLLLAFGGSSLTAIAKPGASPKSRSPMARAATAEAPKPSASAEARVAARASARPAHTGECPGTTHETTACDETDATDAKFAIDSNADDGDAALEPNSTEAIAHGRIRLTVDELIELRAQGVTTADILEMRSVFPNIDIRHIAGMYAVGATPEYVLGLRAAGLDVRKPDDAKSLAAVGVTPEFIASISAAGLEVSPGEAASLAAVGVSAEYIQGLRAAGFEVTSADEVRGMAAVGVTPRYIRDMRAAGFAIATAHEAQSLAAVGVTPEYARGMRATGLKLASADELRSLAAVGVTPEYVREILAAGIRLRDASEAQSLAAVGVSSKFVRQLAKAGYSNLSASDLCRLAAGGVTDSFIEEMSQYRTR